MLLLMVAVLGCGGPSSAEIKTAKTARYSAEPDILLDITLQVAQRDYKIGQVDALNRRFATAPQFYSKEGGRQSPGAGGFVSVSAGSVELMLVVEIVPAESPLDGHHVVVTPVTFQIVSGSPKPRELKPDDPSLPPWVLGRADALAVAIHAEAKPHLIEL